MMVLQSMVRLVIMSGAYEGRCRDDNRSRAHKGASKNKHQRKVTRAAAEATFLQEAAICHEENQWGCVGQQRVASDTCNGHRARKNMWKRKSMPGAPKNTKFVTKRHNCSWKTTSLRLKYSENGEITSSAHSAVTPIATDTYARVIGGTA